MFHASILYLTECQTLGELKVHVARTIMAVSRQDACAIQNYEVKAEDVRMLLAEV